MPHRTDRHIRSALVEPLEPRQLLASQTPFYGVPYNVPISIQAEQYDSGGAGISYSDAEGKNLGNATYRKGGVDFNADPNTAGNYFVSHTRSGEWLEYTINVKKEGYFRIDTRLSCGGSGGKFHLFLDGVDQGTGRVKGTGGWDVFRDVSRAGLKFSTGQHVLRLEFTNAAVSGSDIADLDWIRISADTNWTASLDQPWNWKKKSDATFARYEGDGAAVNGKLYVFGGYVNTQIQGTARSDRYDPATDTWTRIADMPEPLTHTGIAVHGTTIWLVGGFVGDHPGPGTTHVWKYNTLSNAWSRGPALPAARGAGAAAIVDHVIHFFGGLTHANSTADPVKSDMADHWTLDLANGGGWKTAASLINPRNHLAGASLNGKVYAIGGQHLWDEDHPLSEVDAYDPATNKWATVASLPQPLSHMSASTLAVNGRIVVIGGATTGFSSVSAIENYNPATNQWKSQTPLPSPLSTPVAGFINNTFVVATGSEVDLVATGDVFIATPA